MHPARLALAFLLCAASTLARAGGGPLGIDRRLTYDNDGLVSRKMQFALEGAAAFALAGGALWEGGESRLGRTFWQSIDASAGGALAAGAMKVAFSRSRPVQSSDPNLWFQGSGHYSFPSGEVTFMAAAVTPFVLEYGREHPAAYALELLPAFDALARMKVGGHWQTDVLAGFALGTAAGYLAHEHDSPVILNALPGGFSVGMKGRF